MQHLTLTFPFSLHPAEIADFRKAINALVGDEPLFHNHDDKNEDTPYVWSYPLVRYGLLKGRAMVSGVGPGADTLMTKLMPKLLANPELIVADQPRTTVGFRLQNRNIELKLHDKSDAFGMHRWVALNADNYQTWKELEGKSEARQMLLGRALTGQLRVLAETLAPEIDRSQVVASVLQIDKQKRIHWHGTQLIGFNVIAESRFVPPYGLGIGRCVAHGFGEVVSPRKYARLLQARQKQKGDEEVV